MPTHDAADFVRHLNRSPWKLAVSETGLGVGLADLLTRAAGASATLILAKSPYSKAVQPPLDRSITRDMARAMAEAVRDECGGAAGDPDLAAVAVTGAHKTEAERGETHAWVCVLAEGRESFAHFWVPKGSTRAEAIDLAARAAAWLLDGVLLRPTGARRWLDYRPDGARFDVLEMPGLGVADHLALCAPDNPLVFAEGRFQRVTPRLRQGAGNLRVYRGSFDPPKASHAAIGAGALFELTLENARKQRPALADIAHRVRMLGLLGVPVLVTDGMPLFVDLHRWLVDRDAVEGGVTYLVGWDTLRAIVAPEFAPEGGFPSDFVQWAAFEVYAVDDRWRKDLPAHPLTVSAGRWPRGIDDDRSADIRAAVAAGLPARGLPPAVLGYIHGHRLYQAEGVTA